ncbi:hypothetical protein ACJJTC_015882 [Scirpophaga incertulas]
MSSAYMPALGAPRGAARAATARYGYSYVDMSTGATWVAIAKAYTLSRQPLRGNAPGSRAASALPANLQLLTGYECLGKKLLTRFKLRGCSWCLCRKKYNYLKQNDSK